MDARRTPPSHPDGPGPLRPAARPRVRPPSQRPTFHVAPGRPAVRAFRSPPPGGEAAPARGHSGPLRRLDDRVEPHLRRGARRLLRALGAPLRGLARAEDRLAGGRPVRSLHAHRVGLALAAALLLVAGSAAHLARYPRGGDRPGTGRGAQPATARGVGPGAPAGGRGEVGPPRGAEVEAYIARRHADLESAPPGEPAVAVVSFAEYVGPDTVTGVLPRGARPLLALVRLPAEGMQPLRVRVRDGDLAGAVRALVEQQRAALAREEREARRLLASGTVGDPAFVADLEQRVAELTAVRNLLEGGAPVVFAVVVRAPVEILRRLPRRGEVRLVDLAPPGTDPAEARFHGLRPEDSRRVRRGRAG